MATPWWIAAILGTAREGAPRPVRERPERVSVRLVLQVPVRDLEAPRSWLGGHPSLPADVPWPERDGRALAFLAQICLDDLPPELWRGDGPREGWLAFFLSPDDHCRPAVLHTRTRGAWREGPSAAGGHWYRRPGTFDEPSWRPNPPRWPVDVRVEITKREEEEEEAESAPAPAGPPDPFDPLEFDLGRPELHPFDAESMRAALDVIQKRVDTAVGTRAAREAAEAAGKRKPPGEADQALLDEVHAGRVAAQRALAAVRDDFERGADVPSLIRALEAISLPSVEAVDRTGFLATGRQFRPGPNAPLTRPYEPYGGGKWALLKPWYDLGRYALTTEPDRVPAPARDLLLRKFAFDAQGQTPRMGHAPVGYYHEDPADDADKVVLLELPTSALMGWIWSDANDVLFGLSRDALRAGRFDEVWVSFSN